MSRSVIIAVGPMRSGKTSLWSVLQQTKDFAHVELFDDRSVSEFKKAIKHKSVFAKCSNTSFKKALAASKGHSVHVVVCTTASDAMSGFDSVIADCEAKGINVVKLRADPENPGEQTWTVLHSTSQPSAADANRVVRSSFAGPILALFGIGA